MLCYQIFHLVTNKELFEKYLCNQNKPYEKCLEYFCYANEAIMYYHQIDTRAVSTNKVYEECIVHTVICHKALHG